MLSLWENDTKTSLEMILISYYDDFVGQRSNTKVIKKKKQD